MILATKKNWLLKISYLDFDIGVFEEEHGS